MTTATLGLAVKYSDVDQAKVSLEQMTASAKKAEAEALKFATSSQKLAAATDLAAQRAANATLAEERLAAARAKAAAQAGIAANQNQKLASSLKATSLNTANVAAQFNDIGVTLASGMSPWMVAIQQGTQLNQVFGNQGVRGTIGLLGGAFSSLLNPVSLATIAIIGLGGSAVQALWDWYSSGEKTEEQLKEQAELIQRAAKQWGDAVPSLQAYVDQLERASNIQDLIQAGEGKIGQQYAPLKETIEDINVQFAGFLQLLQDTGVDAAVVSDLNDRFQALREKTDENTASAKDANSVLDLLNGTMLNGVGGAGALIAALEGIIPTLNQISRSARATRQEISSLVRGDRDDVGSYNRDPDKPTMILPDTVGVTPDRRVDPYFAEASRKGRGGKTDIEKARDAYRDLIKSADDRIAQMQVELDLVGKVGTEAEALRYETELLNQATDKGRKLNPEQIAAIKAKAEAYAELKAAIAEARALENLMFDRDQMGRSAIDQKIASTMRSAGLEVDLSSPMADAIRLNEQLARTRELLEGVASDITSGLKEALSDGKLEWQELGQIALNVLQRIADELIKMATDQMIAWIMKGIIGGIGGGIGGGDPWAGLRMANGGVFSGGNVIPFARGGVVSQPTLFPMARGMGLMGEAGPEAIMPLSRGPGGKLGVAMHGGGVGGSISMPFAPVISIGEVGSGVNKAEMIETIQRAIQESLKQFEKMMPQKVAASLHTIKRYGLAS